MTPCHIHFVENEEEGVDGGLLIICKSRGESHYVIRRNGEIEPGRPEWMVGAHCLHHNAHSIGICYEGGLDIRGQPADMRTAEQKAAMRQLLEDLHWRYPRAVIVGHHDLDPTKSCPCIKDVAREYADLQPK